MTMGFVNGNPVRIKNNRQSRQSQILLTDCVFRIDSFAVYVIMRYICHYL